jgi:hypothetical protein
MFSPYHPLGLIHLNSTAKKNTDGDGVRQNDFHRIGMALQLQQNPNGTFLD